MAKKSKNKSSILKKTLIVLALFIIAGGVYSFFHFYESIYQTNVNLKDRETTYIYIKTGSNFSDLADQLYSKNIILDKNSFEWLAERKKYKHNIKAGRYLIKDGMNNNQLINLLRSGNQTPIKLLINKVRVKKDLASQIGKQLEVDSTELLSLLNDDEFLNDYHLDKENSLTLFLANTYEFYWNTSAREFFERMKTEYDRFWTEERVEKASNHGLSPAEAIILASIVEKETAVASEKPTVAGVYVNRLKKGMLLQADPTLIYAAQDFGITRVLNKHKKIDSPYNTYLYKGLPPGPICLPELSTIEAVLNHKKHNYLFFCANSDMSGTHVFAKTYNQHLVNARKFQRELNRRKIYR